MLASQASGGPGGHSFVRRTFSLEFTQTAQCPTCAREPEALLFSTNLYYIPASAVAENREDVPFGSLLRRASPLTSLPAARSLCARLRICACARCVHLCACGCVWACMLQAVDVYGGAGIFFLKKIIIFLEFPSFVAFFGAAQYSLQLGAPRGGPPRRLCQTEHKSCDAPGCRATPRPVATTATALPEVLVLGVVWSGSYVPQGAQGRAVSS